MSRGVLAVLLLLLTAAVQKASAQRTYVGCFQSTKDEMLPSTEKTSDTPISLDDCEAHCGPNPFSPEGYTMMGLAKRTVTGGGTFSSTKYICSCGWTSGRNPQDDSKCTSFCPGSTTDKCGELTYIAVYRLVPEATMFAKTSAYYSGNVIGESKDYSNCVLPSAATRCNCPNNKVITGLYRDGTSQQLSSFSHFRCMGPEDATVNMHDDFRLVDTVWDEHTWIECPDNNALRGFKSAVATCDTIDCITDIRCQTAVLNGVTMARSDVFYMDMRDCMVDGYTGYCDLPTNAFLVGMFRPDCDTIDCITHVKYAFFDGVVTLAPTEPPATDPPATDPPATDPPATDPPATDPPATDPPATDPPATDPPATDPPATDPPATDPPATDPPATDPPATDPPATDPPATDPPATDPPATNPPATDPPATDPPATDPPATDPPATDPPATDPPATDPPATDPPATDPPATDPPATDPPATDPPSTNPPATVAPATIVPTGAPDTNPPTTVAPATIAPSDAPATTAPLTAAPATIPPTQPPTTTAPLTVAPATIPPTNPPTTTAPLTDVPQTVVPTIAPTTTAPLTEVPPTGAPTGAPLTPFPETSAPLPTGMPTASPTDVPTPVPLLQTEETPAPVETAAPRYRDTATSGLKAESKESVQTTTTVASSAAVAGGAAGNAGKLAVLNSFGCEMDDVDVGDEKLDWEFHPLVFPIGASRGKYKVAAMVMNPLLIFCIGMIALAVSGATQITLGYNKERSLGLARFPGVLYVPYLFLLQGTSLVSTQVVFDASRHSGGVVVFAAVVLAACLASPAALYFFVLRKVTLNAELFPDPAIYGNPGTDDPGPRANSLLYKFAFGRDIWVSRDSYFSERYGICFESLRPGCLWYVVAELLCILLLSLLSGWKPTTKTACDTRNYSIAAMLTVFFLATAMKRPFIAPMDNFVAIAMSFSMALAVIGMSIAISAEMPKDASLYVVCMVALMTAAVLIMLKCVWDFVLYAMDVCIARRSGARDLAREAYLNKQHPTGEEEELFQFSQSMRSQRSQSQRSSTDHSVVGMPQGTQESSSFLQSSAKLHTDFEVPQNELARRMTKKNSALAVPLCATIVDHSSATSRDDEYDSSRLNISTNSNSPRSLGSTHGSLRAAKHGRHLWI